MSSTHEPPVVGPDLPLSPDPRTITDFSDFFDAMAGNAKGYVATERAYLTLLLAKRASDVSKSLVGIVIGAIIIAVMTVFASVAGAIALGRALGDPALGYLIMTGIYAVLLVIFLSLWSGRTGDRFKLTIINLLHGH